MASPSYNPSGNKPSTMEMGTTGLRHMSGQIDEEDIRQLRWPHCIAVYRQMESDPLISGALFAIRQFIRSSEWTVEEYKGENRPSDSAEQAKFLRECMDDMDSNWSTFLDNALSMLVYGFSVHEITYKKRLGRNNKSKAKRSKYNDGKFGWRGFPIRSQDTIEEWGIDKYGSLEWVRQQDHWQGIDVKIPEDRFLLFRTSAYKDNPQGRSILRSAYRGYYQRRNMEIQEGIGTERDLSGLPVLRIPSEYMSGDASEDEKAIARMYDRIGANLKRNEQGYVVLPSDIYGNEESATGNYKFDIELLSSSGNRQVDTGSVIERYDMRIMQSMLTDFLMLGGSVGSYALSSNKVMAFVTAIESYLDVIAEQFNDKAIPLLWEANDLDPATAPRLKHSGVENTDLETLGKFLENAASAGMLTTDEATEEAIRRKANLPERDPESEEAEMARQVRRAQAANLAAQTTAMEASTSVDNVVSGEADSEDDNG